MSIYFKNQINKESLSIYQKYEFDFKLYDAYSYMVLKAELCLGAFFLNTGLVVISDTLRIDLKPNS